MSDDAVILQEYVSRQRSAWDQLRSQPMVITCTCDYWLKCEHPWPQIVAMPPFAFDIQDPVCDTEPSK